MRIDLIIHGKSAQKSLPPQNTFLIYASPVWLQPGSQYLEPIINKIKHLIRKPIKNEHIKIKPTGPRQ